MFEKRDRLHTSFQFGIIEGEIEEPLIAATCFCILNRFSSSPLLTQPVKRGKSGENIFAAFQQHSALYSFTAKGSFKSK